MIYLALIPVVLCVWLFIRYQKLAARESSLSKNQEAVLGAMQRLEEQLHRFENERKSDYGSLHQELATLVETDRELKKETANLVKALRSPVGRGRWGEIQLRRVVELAGMLSHCDFFEQAVHSHEEGRHRPDLLVKLPGDRQVIVDAKVPLEAYLEAIESSDDGVRSQKMKDHARHLRQHIGQLSRKAYWDHFNPAPEFVILFLPSETVFGAALEHDPSLIDVGAVQNVILATPTTLIALLRAVAYGWKQESLSKHAEEVQKLGNELYKRLCDLQAHWMRLGKSLTAAVDSYNKATGSLESRVLASARKFHEMGAASASDELSDTTLVDTQVRELNQKDS